MSFDAQAEAVGRLIFVMGDLSREAEDTARKVEGAVRPPGISDEEIRRRELSLRSRELGFEIGDLEKRRSALGEGADTTDIDLILERRKQELAEIREQLEKIREEDERARLKREREELEALKRQREEMDDIQAKVEETTENEVTGLRGLRFAMAATAEFVRVTTEEMQRSTAGAFDEVVSRAEDGKSALQKAIDDMLAASDGLQIQGSMNAGVVLTHGFFAVLLESYVAAKDAGHPTVRLEQLWQWGGGIKLFGATLSDFYKALVREDSGRRRRLRASDTAATATSGDEGSSSSVTMGIATGRW